MHLLLQYMILHSLFTQESICGNHNNMTKYIESEVFLSTEYFHASYMSSILTS